MLFLWGWAFFCWVEEREAFLPANIKTDGEQAHGLMAYGIGN